MVLIVDNDGPWTSLRPAVSRPSTNGMQNTVASRSTEEEQVDREIRTTVCLGV